MHGGVYIPGETAGVTPGEAAGVTPDEAVGVTVGDDAGLAPEPNIYSIISTQGDYHICSF